MHYAFVQATAILTSVNGLVDDPQVFVSALRVAGERMIQPALTIVVIVTVTVVLLRLLRTVVRSTITRVMQREGQPRRELALKANTLANVIESAGRMVIVIIAAMMVLDAMSVPIAPLLASAGVVGIAIGLGAQSLIKDVLGGFFILFEDQYGVGDVIAVGDQSGLVEQLSLRRTGLRALDGSFIVVPNGDIRTVTNLTKGWSRAVIDVSISYDDDIDQAVSLLQGLVEKLEDDPVIGDAVLGPGEVTGVEALGPYQVTLRAMVKTRPMEQWRVQRELRRRIKRLFDERNITIPYPHSVTLLREAGEASRIPHPVAARDRDLDGA